MSYDLLFLAPPYRRELVGSGGLNYDFRNGTITGTRTFLAIWANRFKAAPIHGESHPEDNRAKVANVSFIPLEGSQIAQLIGYTPPAGGTSSTYELGNRAHEYCKIVVQYSNDYFDAGDLPRVRYRGSGEMVDVGKYRLWTDSEKSDDQLTVVYTTLDISVQTTIAASSYVSAMSIALGLIDKVNTSSYTLDGITYAAQTLRFISWEVADRWKLGTNGTWTKIHDLTYNIGYRGMGWNLFWRTKDAESAGGAWEHYLVDVFSTGDFSTIVF